MISKTFQSLVPELPKLEPGEPGTRARWFRQWLTTVTQALEPDGPYVSAWWSWIRTSAENAHNILVTKPLDQREQIYPRESIPPQFSQLESWLRPRVLACLPKSQRE